MLLSQVEAKREQMRPSERKLADYVLEAPREVLDLSMTDFAARAGVSQPTIARFCQALGFSGFREFKIRLAQNIAADVPTVYRDVRTDEPPAGVAAKVLDRTIGALIAVRNSLSSDSVAAAIAILAEARADRVSPRSICSTNFFGWAYRLSHTPIRIRTPLPPHCSARAMSSSRFPIPGAPETFSTRADRR
jgi:transcriptional regulator with XRE-family HTH domain